MKPTMHQCIYTKEQFKAADGEHILQNFLGARWTSSEISSNQAQHQFGNTIDVALANGLKEIRNLLGARGGRGDTGPSLKNISGSEGTRFTVYPGGKPNIAEPVIKATQMPDGKYQVQATLGDMKQLGWAVAKLRQMFLGSNFDIEELRQHAVVKSTYVNEYLTYSCGLGGDEFFRGALKAAFNLIGVSDADIALLGIFDEIRTFILSGAGDCKNFVRWLNVADETVLPKIGEFDQFVCVYSKDGCVDGYIQFYGEIGFSLRLAKGYIGREFCYGYLVDSLRDATPAEIRNPSFRKENIPAFESGSPLPDEAVWQALSTRFSRILERHYKRADMQSLSRIVDDVLLPHIGKATTKEMLDELSQKAAEYITRRIFMSQPK